MKQEPRSIDYRSLLEDGLLQLEKMQSKLDALEYAQTEPIAIVGMGCRFPGGIDHPAALWRILRSGVDTITEVPKNRWDADAYYDPDPNAIGKMYTRYGSFVNEVDAFDASFFNISPREAISLDPQQRLLLEVSWHALEDSHQVPENLYESLAGVFIGICNNDYARRLSAANELNAYFGTGNAYSTVAGRLSYFLGLTGPSLAVDTACSSSLVAVHLACQSLRKQECNLALAGGVNLLLSPEGSIVFSQAKMLSPDGSCKTFDADADGYVRGEGCGVIVLKRLSDAIKNQDNILALIRGSAINHDGSSGGLTVPNGPSQQKVICQALENGGVEPSEVSYIEAHGTGTSLGDPIEVGALGAVFGGNHSPENPLMIASLKTNMGHLEAAAGIAGLIKTVLQLQHQEIVPHLHLNKPNPYINWDEMPVSVPTQLTPWSVGSQKRIAGVSSFGFSGTNAHVVLQEAPIPAKIENFSERPLHLLTLSAKTPKALEELVSLYRNHLENKNTLTID
jgi:acyl transferase domain-containing protein